MFTFKQSQTPSSHCPNASSKNFAISFSFDKTNVLLSFFFFFSYWLFFKPKQNCYLFIICSPRF